MAIISQKLSLSSGKEVISFQWFKQNVPPSASTWAPLSWQSLLCTKKPRFFLPWTRSEGAATLNIWTRKSSFKKYCSLKPARTFVNWHGECWLFCWLTLIFPEHFQVFCLRSFFYFFIFLHFHFYFFKSTSSINWATALNLLQPLTSALFCLYFFKQRVRKDY